MELSPSAWAPARDMSSRAQAWREAGGAEVTLISRSPAVWPRPHSTAYVLRGCSAVSSEWNHKMRKELIREEF